MYTSLRSYRICTATLCNTFSLLFISLLLSGCTHEERIEGTRQSIILNTAEYSLDGADNIKVVIPEPDVAFTWPTTNSNHKLSSNIYGVNEQKRKRYKIQINSLPAIEKNKLYAIDEDGVVYGFETKEENGRSNKKLMWKNSLFQHSSKNKNDLYSSISMLSGKLLVTLGSNTIYALSPDDGSVIWSRELSSPSRSMACQHEGNVLVQTIDNKVYAIKIYDGALVWKHNIHGSDITIASNIKPIIVGDKVVVQYGNGDLYGLNAHSGKESWSWCPKSGYKSFDVNNDRTFFYTNMQPLSDGKTVFVCDNIGSIAAISPANGNNLWFKQMQIMSRPYLIGNMIYALTRDSKLLGIHKDDGKIKFITDMKKYVVKSSSRKKSKKNNEKFENIVVADNRLLLVSSIGRSYTLSMNDGALIQRFQLNGIHDVHPNSIACSGNKIYLISDNQLSVIS